MCDENGTHVDTPIGRQVQCPGPNFVAAASAVLPIRALAPGVARFGIRPANE
jgi:hypothetical protein